MPLVRLSESDTVRLALNACARKLDGSPAAATTTSRKRAVLYNALGYAVERDLLQYNPVDKVQWRAPAVAERVDRRVVASTAQVEQLLAAVPAVHRRGDHFVATYGTTPDGRLFQSARGGYLPEAEYGRIWKAARQVVLTSAQVASPLAGRPYDLRHAAVTLWLSGGVPAPEIAARVGHGVEVLLRVYAGCIDGEESTVIRASRKRYGPVAAAGQTRAKWRDAHTNQSECPAT